ncbi:MAG: hypothetical protein AAF228_11050 [Pseudomonadota bacterium]
MTDFLLSAATRSNLAQLRSIDNLLEASERRISTGRDVVTPLDNPAAFFQASNFKFRAGNLNTVLDDIGTKVQTIRAADEAVNSLITLVNNTIADLNSALTNTEPKPTATGNIVVSGETDVTNLSGVADANTFTIQVGSGSATTITIDTGDSITTLLNEIDAVANVDASLTTEGFLQIASTTNDDLILTNTGGTPLAGLGITAGTFNASSNVSSFRTAKATSFDSVRTQIDQLAADASFQNKNLLLGDNLEFTFNEDGSSSLSVSGVTFTASGLSIDAAVNNFQLDTNINAAKADLEAALDTLNEFSSTLSTSLSVVEARQDFTTNIVELLNDGADDLTAADLEQESALLLALQTRQDLAVTALTILQDSEATALNLFS